MIRAEMDLDHKVGCHLTNSERPLSLTIPERCKSSSRNQASHKNISINSAA